MPHACSLIVTVGILQPFAMSKRELMCMSHLNSFSESLCAQSIRKDAARRLNTGELLPMASLYIGA